MCEAHWAVSEINVHSALGLQALELSRGSDWFPRSLGIAPDIQSGIGASSHVSHLLCRTARPVHVTLVDPDTDGSTYVALEVTCLADSSCGLRGVSGAAADEGATAGGGGGSATMVC